MAARDWRVGAASALAGAGILAAALSLDGPRLRQATPPSASEAGRTALTQAQASRLAAFDRREQALDEREAAVAARELAFAESRSAEVTARTGPAALPPAPAPASRAALSPEEARRQEILQAAEKLGAAFAGFAEMKQAGREATQEEQVQALSDLMPALLAFTRHKSALHGDLAVDALTTFFDSFMPEGLDATEDQKARFRQGWLDFERQLAMYDIPQETVWNKDEGAVEKLPEDKRARYAEAEGTLGAALFFTLRPDQAAHLQSLEEAGKQDGEVPEP